jgi:hexosaminidase
LVNSKGKEIIGWDEILDGELAPGSAVMSWRNKLLEIDAAKRGHNVVMAPMKYTYLDYVQGDNLVEPNFFRELRLSTCYEFEPIPDGLEPEYHKYIIGGQGNLWTENVANGRHAEYMTWPRSLALSEVFWSPKSKRNWADFTRRMEWQFKYMDVSQVKYARSVYDPIISAVKDPESSVKEKIAFAATKVDTTFYPKFHGQPLDTSLKIKLSTEMPGLDIYYTFDGTNPDNFYPKYEGQPLDIPKGAWGDSEIRVITYKNGKPVGKQINCTLSEFAKRVAPPKKK